MMIIVNGGTSYKYSVYPPDKSDKSTIQVFDTFHIKAETATGKKIQQLWTDWAYKLTAW